MENYTEKIESVTQKKLFYSTWKPGGEIKAVVLLVHGFGEHCSRYEPYIKYFLEQGIAFAGFDHLGHGKSDGKRGVIHSYAQLLHDVDAVVSHTKKSFPGIPFFIYGHSMGGNITLNYLLNFQPELKGAMLTSPWLRLTTEPGKAKVGFINFLSHILPNMTINSGLDVNHISTIKQEVELYKNDPLNHGKISFRMLTEVIANGEKAIGEIDKLQVPVMLSHGLADQITSPKASAEIAGKKNDLVTFWAAEDRYHELHNDTVRKELAERSISFILQHLG